MNRNQNTEQDIRLRMLNSFLSCPHRDTEQLKEIHSELQKADPVFYAHLAAWYYIHGDIRDHKEVFAGALICDEYLENRETGIALFRRMPPFLKKRIIGFIKGKKIKIRTKTGKKIVKNKKSIDEVTVSEKSVGLYKNIPTVLKTDTETYLKWLEQDNDRFDSIALRNFNDLKGLYASLQIKPSIRAQQILFKKKYPKDSKLNIFSQISKAEPAEQAKLIVQNKIPYPIAVGLVESITPSILLALINAMTPQEVINNIASLEEKGAMDNEDTKNLINKRLEEAKKSKKVSALKSKEAVKTARITNEETIKKLDTIADVQIKKSGAIIVPTAIFIDKSGSMDQAIETGKNVSAVISGATEADLYVIAFDTMAREIIAQGKNLTDWEKAFSPIRSNGSTSVGIAMDFLIRKSAYVEQVVIITDEDENQAPRFVDVYENYVKKFNTKPHVVIIHMGAPYTGLSTSLKAKGITFDSYKPAGNDYYALPGLITLLSRKSNVDLLYEIMNTPLPTRKIIDIGGKIILESKSIKNENANKIQESVEVA